MVSSETGASSKDTAVVGAGDFLPEGKTENKNKLEGTLDGSAMLPHMRQSQANARMQNTLPHQNVTVRYLSFGHIETNIMFSVTSACARRTGTAARVERRRREVWLLCVAGVLAGVTRPRQARPLSACTSH